MLVIGIAFSLFGLGFFCWLIFTLAVYALPCFAGVTAGFAVFHAGAGGLEAISIGTLAAIATMVIGQVAIANLRTPVTRSLIAMLYAVPASIAGYHATLGLSQIGISSEAWCVAFAVLGAVLIGSTAFVRMFLFSLLPGDEVHGMRATV